MKITLSIDDDVAAQLKRLRRERDINVEYLINEVLRRGLREVAAAQFGTKSFDTGRPLIPNLNCIGEVLADLDAERFIEQHRRISK